MTTALAKLFFRSPYMQCRTPSDVIGWWETRRLPYNLVVGAAGAVTLTGVHLLAALPPHAQPIPLLPSLAVAAAYGVMANICYSVGWLAELMVRKHGGESLEPVGPAMFRYGFAFSVGLTLFPLAIGGLDFALRVIRTIFG